MARALRGIVRDSLAWMGLPRFLQRVGWRDRLTIVMYHAVVSEGLPVADWCFLDLASFRRQMDYLARHFDVLPLSLAVERLREGSLRRPSAVITFDDGYRNNRDVAWPVLVERGLPATIFLATGLTGTDDTVWYCRLNGALAATSRQSVTWEGEWLDLATPAARTTTARALQARLKSRPHPLLLAELREILRALGDDPDRGVEPASPYRMLAPDDIAEMRASGLVEFGAHTHSHAILARLSPDQEKDEIDRSLAAVEKLTGEPCRLFSYPNGGWEDFDAPTVEALRQRGVRAAVTSVPGSNDMGTPVLELRRYGVGTGLSQGAFAFMVHHCSSWPTRGETPRTEKNRR